jgi:RNA polymerase subunit RPABC4/transcription elongation factor Spt4
MSFLEDLFEGRRQGYRGGHGHHGDDHDDHNRVPEYQPRYGPIPAAAQAACPQCRTLVSMLPGYRFCPYCGGSLATTPVCAGCGTARTPGAAFCPGCGAKL